MQLYLNSLTQTKLAVFLFPQIAAQNEICHSRLAFSWGCSWISSQMQSCCGVCYLKKAQGEKKTVSNSCYSLKRKF